MKINREKTQIVHFRRAKITCTEFQFSIGKDNLTVSSKYKYLGRVLNETLDLLLLQILCLTQLEGHSELLKQMFKDK